MSSSQSGHALDQLIEIEDEEVPAALLVAQRDDLHVARLDGAKRPAAMGGA